MSSQNLQQDQSQSKRHKSVLNPSLEDNFTEAKKYLSNLDLQEKLSESKINVRKELSKLKINDILQPEKEPSILPITKGSILEYIPTDNDDINYFKYLSDIYIRIYNKGLEKNNGYMFDVEKIKEFKKLTIKEFVDNPHSGYEIKEDDEG